MIDEYDITRQFVEALNKPKKELDKDSVIDEYAKYFKAVGFVGYSIDFDSVDAEVIVLLGETLKTYLAKGSFNDIE